MRALTVMPGRSDSVAVVDMPDPNRHPDELLVDGVALGICGTDREIVGGSYGWAPPGADRLILGHESLGRVREVPADSDFNVGDYVVGVVRRPDPAPCGACAHGQFDMCRNGRYTERGIKELDGYGSEQWTLEPQYAVLLDSSLNRVGVLLEPTSVVAKAWTQIEKIGQRAWFDPQRVLVTGAGPIGLLAALLGKQRGLDVHVLDRVTDGAKPEIVAELGATYHTGDINEIAAKLQADVAIEATGAGPVILGAIAHCAAYGIVCLTGVSSGGRTLSLDAARLNREIVLENDVVVGSVNANLSHYQAAANALAEADAGWLSRLITRRLPLARAKEALVSRTDDIKVVIDLQDAR